MLPEELNLSVSFNEDQLSLLRAEEKEPDAGQESRGKHHKLSSTERILRRIESNRKSHLNKSYLLMRFVDYESKQKLLSPDMRLFGWNLSRNLNVRFDDAGEKKTIVVSNISWGTKLGEVESWINDLLDEYGYSNLGCFCAERDKILTKNYVFFTLGSFWESLKVIQILNGQQFNVLQCLCSTKLSKLDTCMEAFEPTTMSIQKIFEYRLMITSKQGSRQLSKETGPQAHHVDVN